MVKKRRLNPSTNSTMSEHYKSEEETRARTRKTNRIDVDVKFASSRRAASSLLFPESHFYVCLGP